MSHYCTVIPVYNHGRQAVAVVEAVRAHNLECILVNDGSDDETRSILDAIERSDPKVSVVHRKQNGGKGAAVADGLRHAIRAGYTHALQIDADGQHQTDDISRMLEASKDNPAALVLGEPRYDESVPASRLWGRKVTNFWVTIETQSRRIRDAMCGFRVYPLPATRPILARRFLGKRMDFDIEIAVRLAWSGLPIINVPTDVDYPEDGSSHFRMGLDNVLISWLHTRLSITAFFLWPLFWWRRRNYAHEQHWAKVNERGAGWGVSLMMNVYRWLGRPFCLLMLYPVIGYFFLTAKRARAASRTYLERLRSTSVDTPRPTAGVIFRHFMEFGRASVDKAAVWIGDVRPEQLEGREALKEMAATGTGGLLLSAHLGNIEIGRCLAKENSGAVVNALMFTEHAQRFNDALRKLDPEVSERLIAVETISPATAVDIKKRIERGEYVAMLADRSPPGATDKKVRVPFLGAEAAFPMGPWVLANALKCPIYIMFFVRQDRRRYRVYLRPFAEQISLPRQERQAALKKVVGDYAAALEEQCRETPLQWFNFYDFWK